MEDDQVDEIKYLTAACNRWRHSQDPQDNEVTRLAAACDRRLRRSQVPRDNDTGCDTPQRHSLVRRHDEITRLAAACERRRRRRAKAPRDDGCWSNLPKDVLSQVICRLPLLNHNLRLRFAAVCHHWHAVERLHLPYSLPKICLALPDGSFFTFHPACSSVLLPRENVSRGSYRGASSSHLLTDTKNRNVYSLVNPFNLRRRPLPVPSGIRVHDHGEPSPEEGYFCEEMPVRKLVVCPDGLVAAIVGHERSAKVALCKPESAWSWFLSERDPWRWYVDMVFFDGKLYALTDDGDLLALEVGAHGEEESNRPRIISHVERVIDGADCRYTLQEYTRMRYLVVRPRGRGLLMVCRMMLEYGRTTYEFAVFQADLRSSRWVQVYTLGGDEALFVGRLCSRAVLADQHWVGSNLIFFLGDDSAGTEGLVRHSFGGGDGLANVYNMKQGTVSQLLPMTRCNWDGAVPATWLFSEDIDADD